jgi:hypothetical protein
LHRIEIRTGFLQLYSWTRISELELCECQILEFCADIHAHFGEEVGEQMRSWNIVLMWGHSFVRIFYLGKYRLLFYESVCETISKNEPSCHFINICDFIAAEIQRFRNAVISLMSDISSAQSH